VRVATVETALVAAELLCGAGLLQPVKAQTGDGSVKFVSYASIGIVHGQKVRLSVANNEESGGTLSLSFSFYLAHGSNASSVGSGIKMKFVRHKVKFVRH